MARPAPAAVNTVALLGTGTIGASWATYYLARGFSVTAWDPAEDNEERLRAFIEAAWPAMERLGLANGADPGRVRVVADPEAAVDGAVFVQESAPEDTALKRELYGRIDPVLQADAVLASSASGLLISELQEGLRNAARFVVGHPFNPPHLVPLVEVVGGRDTDPATVDWVIDFYNAHGKRAIRVEREVPGHIANRLQAALLREAFHLFLSGVASAADIDAAVSQGPGLRWAFMGPFLTMHLAGGEGGMRGALNHFGPGLEHWWADSGTPRIDEDAIEAMGRAVDDMLEGQPIPALAAARDTRLLALLAALETLSKPRDAA